MGFITANEGLIQALVGLSMALEGLIMGLDNALRGFIEISRGLAKAWSLRYRFLWEPPSPTSLDTRTEVGSASALRMGLGHQVQTKPLMLERFYCHNVPPQEESRCVIFGVALGVRCACCAIANSGAALGVPCTTWAFIF